MVKMKLAYSNKERVLKSPYYLAVNPWNQLDETIQLSKDKKEFKKILKGWDMDGLRARDVCSKII